MHQATEGLAVSTSSDAGETRQGSPSSAGLSTEVIPAFAEAEAIVP